MNPFVQWYIDYNQNSQMIEVFKSSHIYSHFKKKKTLIFIFVLKFDLKL